MATDVNVQFFSHLNGLALGNNWGDLIRLLDTCLVNGLALPSVTAASIDANGDINLTFFAAHNAVLFQIAELTGFSPSNINAKYRIKGLPTSTQMILKAELTGQSITVNGSAKLAALGYDIIFRDANDVKRVYRAKNPRSEHPFIRVDETISDGTNSYTSTYAKYAMVGLIENMAHIDDYSDTSKLQLPLDTADFAKNWKISGTGTSVVRGWSRWYWRRGLTSAGNFNGSGPDSLQPSGSANFTLCGDVDAFYMLLHNKTTFTSLKTLYGCGLYNSALDTNIVKNWFCMTTLSQNNASTSVVSYNENTPLMQNAATANFLTTKNNITTPIQSNTLAQPVVPDFASGFSDLYSANNISALEIPFSDTEKYLRGTLKHVCYSGKMQNTTGETTPLVSGNDMYVWDTAYSPNGATIRTGGFYFYLGELI